MSLVVLARHGQALPQSYTGHARGGDAGLSELGRSQATVLGAELLRSGLVPDVVISGGLARQSETAETCLDALGRDGLKVEVDRRWQEYDVEPVLAAYASEPVPGAPSANPKGFQHVLDAALRRWMVDPAPPDGLTPWPDFASAAPTALAELTQRLGSGKTAMVFTSAGPIAAIAAALLGLDTEAFLALHRVVVNASITKVISGSRGSHLLTFNEHGHLVSDAGRFLTYR
jgi:broad specificity phosphatase PhoE